MRKQTAGRNGSLDAYAECDMGERYRIILVDGMKSHITAFQSQVLQALQQVMSQTVSPDDMLFIETSIKQVLNQFRPKQAKEFYGMYGTLMLEDILSSIRSRRMTHWKANVRELIILLFTSIEDSPANFSKRLEDLQQEELDAWILTVAQPFVDRWNRGVNEYNSHFSDRSMHIPIVAFSDRLQQLRVVVGELKESGEVDEEAYRQRILEQVWDICTNPDSRKLNDTFKEGEARVLTEKPATKKRLTRSGGSRSATD